MQASPSRKRSFLETLFKPEESEDVRFSYLCGKKNLRTEIFKNNGVTIIM